MPSSFTTPLVVEPLPNGRWWRVVHEFTYHVGSEDSGFEIRVPEGFITDFGSIPQFLWSFGLWPLGLSAKAFVLHDFLYTTAKLSRAMADAILLEAMWVLGEKWWKRCLTYSFVRLLGRWSFPSKRREIVEEKIAEKAEQHAADVELNKEAAIVMPEGPTKEVKP